VSRCGESQPAVYAKATAATPTTAAMIASRATGNCPGGKGDWGMETSFQSFDLVPTRRLLGFRLRVRSYGPVIRRNRPLKRIPVCFSSGSLGRRDRERDHGPCAYCNNFTCLALTLAAGAGIWRPRSSCESSGPRNATCPHRSPRQTQHPLQAAPLLWAPGRLAKTHQDGDLDFRQVDDPRGPRIQNSCEG
jgi:hypothetical protein